MNPATNSYRKEYHEISDDSDDDEWYYSSISRFEKLQMFDFETPAQHLDFSERDKICFTGKIRNNQQEILEFSLPEKLSSSALESHDLKLKSGGFSCKPVYQMKCLLGQRKLILSEDGLSGASIYELGCEKSDYINKVGDIKCEVAKAQLAVMGNKIALASSTHDVHLCEDGSVIRIPATASSENSSNQIIGLSFFNDNTLAYCESSSCQISLLDIRSNCLKKYSPGISASKIWDCFGVQCGGNCFGLVSSQEDVVIIDSRTNHRLLETKLESGRIGADKSHMKIKFSPHNDNLFSVSGSNGILQVFLLKTEGISKIFSYDGHNRLKSTEDVLIVDHTWSPVQDKFLFSSGSNGSFHCWKFM